VQVSCTLGSGSGITLIGCRHKTAYARLSKNACGRTKLVSDERIS